VAAAELGVMAGADRVEGTLFGNGERTGNVDIVTLALNLMSVGVDPGLDFADIDERVALFESCTGMSVHPRHPYAGELVYTAFSGSHQDAIRKGMAAIEESRSDHWEVPYLPIDPKDVGRSYEAVIRINSQSGKGGVAWVLEQDHGVRLPRGAQVEFSRRVQALADESGGELTSRAVWEAFCGEFLERDAPVAVTAYEHPAAHDDAFTFELRVRGESQRLRARGNGPIDAFARALEPVAGGPIQVHDYSEHALGEGADARAVAYVEAQVGQRRAWGVGLDADIVLASLRALASAANRLLSVSG